MNRIINNLKTLSIDMIDNAQSGHPGICLSSASIMYTIFSKHMHINPQDPAWLNRDRFVLSAGHGSALLYATLYMIGFITLKDLKEYRKINSITKGHPEYNLKTIVETTTGPLGQGLATAVGMAIGEKHLQAIDKNNLIDYKIYVLCSDGDLMEGISYEACSLAGTLQLDNLIILYDSNNISLDGETKHTMTENICERFDAMGFYTAVVKNKPEAIDKAIKKAKKSKLPSLIEVKTIIGEGSKYQGTNKVHGKPLEKKDVQNLHKKLNIYNEPFYVDEEARKEFIKQISDRTKRKYQKWKANYNLISLDTISNIDMNELYSTIPIPNNQSLIESNHTIMNYLSKKTNLLFGGAADTITSNKTYQDEFGLFSKENYAGRNIYYGVREQAMGAITNGLALTSFIPYSSTYLSFSNYMLSSIRMGAMMNLPVTYIFTHDSINIGPDGPTHQPIEQLSMLRAIPNLLVFRPADYNEIVGVWDTILKLDKPSAIVLSKAKLPTLEYSNPLKVIHGAYIVLKEQNSLDAILIATGSEVSTCINIAKKLKNYNIRVVSMPSVELFKKQSQEYQNYVLPLVSKKIIIEAASSIELREFVTNNKYMITLNHYGISGITQEVLDYMEFSEEKITNKIIHLID